MSELQRGYDTGDMDVKGPGRLRGPKIFWLPPGGETTIVILDEPPVKVVRHKLFLRGDKRAAKMRQTCWGMNPATHGDPCPRECLVCNAQARYPRNIGRDAYAYVTIIDEREFTFQGRQFKDMKMLLELGSSHFNSFAHLHKTYGTMKYRRFHLYRTNAGKNKPQAYPQHGDHWRDLGVVDPVQHFWASPAIPAIMEAARRRQEQPKDHMGTLTDMISPIDYNTDIGKYEREEAEAFVAYLEGCLGNAQPQQGAWASMPPAGGQYAPPSFPTSPQPAAPGQYVPPPIPGAPTAPSTPSTPPWETAPAAAPTPPPPAPAQPTPPPPVPNPQPAYTPPPPPPAGTPAAPSGLPMEGTPRAPSTAPAYTPPPPPAPAAQPSAAPQQVGQGYEFQQGWNQQPKKLDEDF